MIDSITASLKTMGSSLEAQSSRLRVIAENIANAESTASTPGGDPYRRKTIAFESEIDRASGARLVRARRVGVDSTPFRVEYNAAHPAADARGLVKLPNVDLLIELADMKDASRAYQTALQAFRQARELNAMTIDLLKG